MNTPIRVLILEDLPADAELMVHELRRAGYDPQWQRVDTEEEYLAALETSPEVILSDNNLPQFDALRALACLQQQGKDIPFIIVSGTIGEEVAVAAMKQGASDYLLKDRLTRLGAAIGHALETKQLRQTKKEAEHNLNRMAQRQQSILRSLPEVLYVIPVSGDSLAGPHWVSENTERITGFPIHVFIKDPDFWKTRLHPEDQTRVLQVMANRLHTGNMSCEYRWQIADGSYRWFLDHAVLVRDAEGQPREFVGSWLDITERKQLEEQYRQAQRMEAVGRLAGGVAHDFNNLLTVILGYSEIALRKLPKENLLHNLLGEIKKSGERAARLTQQLLTFSRKQILQPQVMDLNMIVSESEKMLRRLIGEDIHMVSVLDPNIRPVKVDLGHMDQLIMNLAVNARDAMPNGGQLTLKTSNVNLDHDFVQNHPEAKAGPYVLLEVSDTGCGMTPEIKARIFDPFFTTKEVGKGTGLGLATVYGIVKQSEGYIFVDSEPDQGATFRIYLPPAVPSAARPPKSPSHHGIPPKQTGTILLVDDDEGVRHVTRLALQNLGFTVLEAASGPEAIKICNQYQGSIDLLLTDIIMPQMNGVNLAKHLSQSRPQMRIIYMSGYTDDSLGNKGILDPNVVLLYKPITASALAKKVSEVLVQKVEK